MDPFLKGHGDSRYCSDDRVLLGEAMICFRVSDFGPLSSAKAAKTSTAAETSTVPLPTSPVAKKGERCRRFERNKNRAHASFSATHFFFFRVSERDPSRFHQRRVPSADVGWRKEATPTPKSRPILDARILRRTPGAHSASSFLRAPFFFLRGVKGKPKGEPHVGWVRILKNRHARMDVH